MTSTNRVFHRIRFFNWLILAYLKKHVLFILIGLSLGILLGLKAKDIYLLIFPQIETQRIGIIGNYTQNSLPIEVQNLISYGLTSANSNWKIIPKAAISFDIKDSGKTYVFHINKALKWQDNKDFTASDINYTFKDVKVKISDPYTIRFELTDPFSPFPSLVTQPLFRKGLIGLGEYKVTAIENEGKFISKLILDKQKKKLIIKFYPTEEEGLLGYKLGEIDTMWGATNISQIKNWKNTKIVATPQLNRYVAIFFNTKDGPFQEKTFRQALSYAIDDKYIEEKKVLTPISPNSWAYNPEAKTYDTNISQSIKLLAKTFTASESAAIKIHLTVLKPYEKYSWIIADSWKKIGIDTKVEIVSFPPARFQVLLAAQEIPLDPDQYLLWHSTSNLNLTGYDNKRVDKLLEDGRQIFDTENRKQIYYDFQKFLVEDSPAIFLYHPVIYTISRS